MPNSSAATANTKSVWLSGRIRLTVPSPGPSEPAAALEGFERLVDVEGVAGGRVAESLDALRHVRNEHVRARKSDRGGAAQSHHPNETHAGEEEQCAPDERDQHRLAEIGLQHEPGDGKQQQREREGIRRHFRPPRRLAEQPCDEDDEGGLEEFRWLDIDPEQNNPAARALDLGAELQRRRDQRKAHQEDDDRKPPDVARRQERGRQHHGERWDQIEHVSADEIKRIEAEARRNRRRRGERKNDSREHEREQRRQQ